MRRQALRMFKQFWIVSKRRMRKWGALFIQYWYVFFLAWLFYYFIFPIIVGDSYTDTGATKMKQGKDVTDVVYIADNIHIDVHVINPKLNSEKCRMSVILRNNGLKDITNAKWGIYLSHLYEMIEQNLQCGLALQRLEGRVYYLTPIPGKFTAIRSDDQITCDITFNLYSSISKRKFMPNWYVASVVNESVDPKVIPNTADENLNFVHIQKSTKEKNDQLSSKQRFFRFSRTSSIFESGKVIPTPEKTTIFRMPSVSLNRASWIILASNTFPNANEFLSQQLKIKIKREDRSVNKVKSDRIEFVFVDSLGPEEYALYINGTQRLITISASSPAGAFYGAQSLTSLYSDGVEVPSLLIKDKPRFPYRSLMLDVARNFHTKDTVIELLEIMAMYKLNKFHFHLTDDEGWRVEIPSFPELTKYGSRRCHNFRKNKCLVPSYGSGPDTSTTGSGFYSVSDYREILKAAEANHIQVIPEVDMPGHALSALQSLAFRKEDSMAGRGNDVTMFDGGSEEESPQGWRKNVLNPCLDSTYSFVSDILDGLIRLHEGVQDLQTVHLGGDEVQRSIWDGSSACQALGDLGRNHTYLKGLFTHKVAEIANKKKLDVIFWNDGVFNHKRDPWDRNSFKNPNVYVNFWHGRGVPGNELMPKFADAGYKVILSMASHFYFDHKYDEHPDGYGQTWATEWIDTYKVFHAIPSSYSLSCPIKDCPKTQRPENYFGIQASLWGEVIRGKSQLHYMLFPRLIALAERAWHKAPWENIEREKERLVEQRKDWTLFANCLGNRELVRLERKGIMYRVPPPNVYQKETGDNSLLLSTVYPNHDVFVKIGTAEEWTHIKKNVLTLERDMPVALKSVSPVLKRSSEIVVLRT